MPDFVHVIPLNDWREHQSSMQCWCHPVADEEEPAVMVHHAMDGREDFETGERKPS